MAALLASASATDPDWRQLPDGALMAIAHHCASSDDLIALTALSGAHLKPYAVARQQFRRLLACLSTGGQHDGAWLDLAPIDVDHLRLPALPPDYPSDLLQFIQRQAAAIPTPSTAASSVVVAGVRRAYPPDLRGVFPHGRKLARDILAGYVRDHPDLLGADRRAAVLDRLRPFGIEFPASLLRQQRGLRSPVDAGDVTPAPERPGPHRFVELLFEAGAADRLPQLFANDAYMQYLKQMEDGSAVGLVAALAPILPSITSALFARIVAVPAVAECLNARDLHGRTLLHQAVRCGRIRDLGAALLAHDQFRYDLLDDGDGPSNTLVHMLPDDGPGPVLDLFRLAAAAPPLRRYLQGRRGLLVARWAARLEVAPREAAPDGLRLFFEALCADPEIAFVVVHVPSAEPTRVTLMHVIVDRGLFDLLPVLMRVPGARFRQYDRDPHVPSQTGTTAIGRLAPKRLAAFASSLPEPKARHLVKFHLPDLAQVLAGAVHGGGQFAGVRALCRILPEVVAVPIGTGETLRRYAERLDQPRTALFLLLVESRLLYRRRASFRTWVSCLGLATSLCVCWCTVP